MADLEHLGIDHGLYEWVESTTQEWRDHFEVNHAEKMEAEKMQKQLQQATTY